MMDSLLDNQISKCVFRSQTRSPRTWRGHRTPLRCLGRCPECSGDPVAHVKYYSIPHSGFLHHLRCRNIAIFIFILKVFIRFVNTTERNCSFKYLSSKMLNKVDSQGFCSFLSTPNILFYQNSTFCCIQNSFHKKFFELYHNQIYFKTILHTARCQSTLLRGVKRRVSKRVSKY